MQLRTKYIIQNNFKTEITTTHFSDYFLKILLHEMARHDTYTCRLSKFWTIFMFLHVEKENIYLLNFILNSGLGVMN